MMKNIIIVLSNHFKKHNHSYSNITIQQTFKITQNKHARKYIQKRYYFFTSLLSQISFPRSVRRTLCEYSMSIGPRLEPDLARLGALWERAGVHSSVGPEPHTAWLEDKQAGPGNQAFTNSFWTHNVTLTWMSANTFRQYTTTLINANITNTTAVLPLLIVLILLIL
jgi:hypothetical protein